MAEFLDPSDAYTFEQQLICDNWENPLLLNGYYRLGKIKQFRRSDPHSDETKQKLSDAMTGRTQSPEHTKKISDAMTGKTQSVETKQRISDARTGKTHSDETRQKMSDSGKGRPAWNKGIPCSAETKQRISDAMTGKNSI